jgi:predicted TIM-barrel fold metal-dependent hydrolase
MFGSNFPVDSLYSSFATLYTAFDEVTGPMSMHERRELFSDTARRAYRIGPKAT